MSATGSSTVWVRTRISAACFSGALSGVVLFGWITGDLELTRIMSGFSAMNPMTALSIFALSAALILSLGKRMIIVRILAGIPVAVGFAKLSQVALHARTGVDQLLFDSGLNRLADVPPNRMAPNTALALALIGTSLLLSGARQHRLKLASHLAAMIVLGITFFAVIGYALRLTGLYEMRHFNAMALHSAVALAAVTVGVITINPRIGAIAIMADKGPAGTLARTTLPIAVMVPVIVGMFRLYGEHADLYGASDGLAIQVFANVLVTFTLLMTSLGVLVRSDGLRRERELAVARSELLYRSVLAASADRIDVLDLDGRLELMNAAGLRAMEIDNADALSGTPWIELWPAESRSLAQTAIADASVGNSARFTSFCPTVQNTAKWWDVMVSPIVNEAGQVGKILSISRDITAERNVAAEIKWASEHDALTGLANRRGFEAHLRGAIGRAMLGDTSVGLLLLDLDHFKHINDTLGHAAGDHLLSVFGKRLKRSVRGHDFVARLGGDEFAIVVEGDGAALDLLNVGDSIISRLQQPIQYDNRAMSAGASIGGAVFPADAETADELLKNADTALYALKESGRGGTRMFHQHMREQAQLISSQLSLARSAITRESVEPHYQQKVDLRTGRITGFEALLRWRHVTRGIQAPDTVFEAFKDYELASKIGNLMQRRVFSDMHEWLVKGLPIGVVAINAAPVEFLRDDFAENLLERIKEHQIPPELVEIEVTEHVFLERSSGFVSRALKVLAAAGIRIALDDFGTGSSSLSHLRDYHVDVVKIDRSFIEKITTDVEVCAIVCAVIDLAKILDIDIVAEGVETEAQKRLLLQNSCVFGQGYLFGRAIPADEIPHLLRVPMIQRRSVD